MSQRTQLTLFFAAVASMSMAVGVHDSIFNNFLSDTFALSAEHRGWLEFPRELPGFLTVVSAAALFFLPVTRVAMVASFTFVIGMIGIAILGTSFSWMVFLMMVGSTGLHLLQPSAGTIAIGLSDDSNRGRRMGQTGGFGMAGTVAGTGLVWLFFDKASPHYAQGFLIVAGLGALAAFLYSFMHVPHLHGPRRRFLVRRRFSLYYLLEILAGARKQVFLTFGPWVLIKIYGAGATSIAGYLLIAAIIGIAFRPVMGRVMDRFGERTVMIFDGLSLSLVCIGYGYAIAWLGTPERALPLASACFVADNLLFMLGDARAVYLSRMAGTHEELNSTLALGVSVNHIASMTIPTVAGALWVHFGYERVFAAAAILAIATAAIALKVPAKGVALRPVSQPTLAEAPEPAAD
ncbi:MAG: MFS transporter [Candidatus Hydrogenedentes bacterium]|nr:MFS transporter [Candidatus Hydrogenedentota bacterium]